MQSLAKLIAGLIFLTSLASHAEHIQDGGMSGGGGGTVPSQPVTDRDITGALYSVRQDLYLYFNTLNRFSTSNDLVDRLSLQMLNKISKVQIYAAKGACKDANGKDVDGSIHSPVPNTICISVPHLVRKLSQNDYLEQTAALVAHEYSHLAGANEAEAQEIQQWVNNAFKYQSTGKKLLDNMKQLATDMQFTLWTYSKNQTQTWNSLCYLADSLDKQFLNLGNYDREGIFSWFNRQTDIKRTSFVLKNIAFLQGTCSKSDYHPNRDLWARNYPEYFNGQDAITDKDLAKKLFFNPEYTLGNLPLRQIKDLSQAVAEMNDLTKYAEENFKDVQFIESLLQEPLTK